MRTADRFLLAGVMGDPVLHSRSPRLHNYWLAQHGLAGTYVPLAVPCERLGAALRALAPLGFSGCYLTIPHKPAALALVGEGKSLARLRAALRALAPLGFSGCNLTIPHKQAALALVDEVNSLARRIGAVNCVVVHSDESVAGYNYHAFGYIEILPHPR